MTGDNDAYSDAHFFVIVTIHVSFCVVYRVISFKFKLTTFS